MSYLSRMTRMWLANQPRTMETFGTFGDVEEIFLSEAPDAEEPRLLTPAAPRAVYAGIRITF